jgi:thiol:disulfide interchange protein DsbA
VLEAFSYGCSACSAAQPYVDRWKAKLPATTAFAYLPVTFRPDFALLARGYLAAQALGVAERTHQPMFDAMRGGTPVTRIEDVADLYAKLGVDRAQFLAAASSFAVSTRLKRIEQSLPRYGIDSSPTFIVAGKYRLTARMAGSYERLFAVIDQLVAREAQASVTAPSAP